MAVRKSKEENIVGLDNAKHEIEREEAICPLDIQKVMTKEGILARPFQVGDFTAVHKKNIHIHGYVDFYGGYANHCREVLFGLDKSGIYNVKLSPIRSPRDIHPDLDSKMRWYINNPAFKKEGSTYLVVAGPGHLKENFIPHDGRRVIGWTMIETLGVQPEIVEWCNNADMILCPTEIDYLRFDKAGIKNLAIVPIGYDPELYHSDVLPMDITNVRNRYVFGVSGSWNHRKGVEDIVHAYCMQFTSDDPVSLMLMCKYGNRPYGEYAEDKAHWGIRRELAECIDRLHMQPDQIPHICVVDRPLHPPALPHLYARADCLVGFSMGESTWLPGLEFTALGKPVIQLENAACGYMDYMHDSRYLCKNVEYVDCDETLYEGTSEYYGGQKMGKGNVYELAEMMQKVYDERGSLMQKNEIMHRQSQVVYRTWDHSIQKLMEVLD